MATLMQAENRVHLNRSGLRNLRRSGRLPGVMFGKNADNEMIHIPTTEFQKWLRQGESGFIELQFDGDRKVPVLLEDLHRDPVTQDLLHVDFQRVQQNEVVRTKIAIELKGTPIGTKQGGIVQVQSAFIEVEALPGDLPATIELDINEMNIGDSIQVKDVVLPAEVTVVSGDNEYLVSCVKP